MKTVLCLLFAAFLLLSTISLTGCVEVNAPENISWGSGSDTDDDKDKDRDRDEQNNNDDDRYDD